MCCVLVMPAVSVSRAAAACIHVIVVDTADACHSRLVLRTAPKYDGPGWWTVDLLAGVFDGDVGVGSGAVDMVASVFDGDVGVGAEAVVVMLVALCSMAAMAASKASRGAARVV